MVAALERRYDDERGLAYHRASGLAGGETPILVLLHGVGLRLESWEPQIKALSARYQVLAFDLPGHGKSARLESSEPLLNDYADRLASSIADISGGQPVYLAGHSLGALITVEIARRYPKLCFGFCALSAIFERSEEARQAVMARADALRESAEQGQAADPEPTLTRWFGAADTPDLAHWAAACRSWLTGGNALGYAQAYQAFAREYGPSRQQLASLAVPGLFATGALDPNSTPTMSQAAASCCPAGSALIVEGAAHMAQLTHPEAVTQALIQHIEAAQRFLGAGTRALATANDPT